MVFANFASYLTTVLYSVIFEAVALASALAVASTVIFRHRTLRMGNFNKQRLIFILSLSYVLPVVMIILPFTIPWDFAAVRAATYHEHPTYDLSIYEPFGGFADHNTFQFIFNTGLVVVAAYTIPFITGVLTKRIIDMINKNTIMSSKTKDQSKTLAYGLALQNILPCISYIPPATSWVISQFGEVEVLYNEHLLVIFISLPALMDPLLSFYFVVPFRHAIYNWLTCKRKLSDTITMSNQSGKFLKVNRNTFLF